MLLCGSTLHACSFSALSLGVAGETGPTCAIYFIYQQRLYVDMVHRTQKEPDSAWRNLYELVNNPDIYNNTE